MGTRITQTVRYIILLYLFVCPDNLDGQIKNKYDLHIKYQINNIISNFDQTYIDNRYKCELPTILGNLKSDYSYEIGLLSSNHSYFIQPGLIYSQMRYSGNGRLISLFNDFHIESYALGLQCKFNLFPYGRQHINPYLQVNASYMFSKLISVRNNYTVNTSSDNSDVIYRINLDAKNHNSTFFSPTFGISTGAEILLIDRVFIISEIGAILKNYPDFDVSSPILLAESSFSIGIRYKILKDKRYLLK